MRRPLDRKAAFEVVCTGCGQRLGDGYHPTCPACGSMSDVVYDLSAVELRDSENPYERFVDLLPVADPSLLPDDMGYTPCERATRLGEAARLRSLYLKDETGLPTASTKDRMAAVALPYLYEHGVRAFATSSTGNSSSAYARALERIPETVMCIFTAEQFRDRVDLYGGDHVVDVVLEEATFVDAFAVAGAFAAERGISAERGFFNPGRREGLKTAWLEAVDQVPEPIDWYVQAVSSAMGVYGVYKAARELKDLGLLERLPRLLCVQQDTCAPMVSAWQVPTESVPRTSYGSRPGSRRPSCAAIRARRTRTCERWSRRAGALSCRCPSRRCATRESRCGSSQISRRASRVRLHWPGRSSSARPAGSRAPRRSSST